MLRVTLTVTFQGHARSIVMVQLPPFIKGFLLVFISYLLSVIFQHGIKKAPNEVCSGGCSERNTRLLQTEKGHIECRHWHGDHPRDMSQPFRIYDKLNYVHIHPQKTWKDEEPPGRGCAEWPGARLHEDMFQTFWIPCTSMMCSTIYDCLFDKCICIFVIGDDDITV